MGIRIEPKTEEQLSTLLPAGDYPFEVFRAEYKKFKRKATGQMVEGIALGLKVYANEGRSILVNDNIIPGQMEHKIKHCCESVGLLGMYTSGELEAEAFLNRSGKLTLKVETDKTGQYPDKNGVKDYIAGESTGAPAQPTASASINPSGYASSPAAAPSNPWDAVSQPGDNIPY